MATKEIKARISLHDNMSATLRQIRREQKQFRKEVNQTRKELDAEAKKKRDIRLNTTTAHKNLKQLRKDMAPIRSKIVKITAQKQRAQRQINEVKSAATSLGKKVFKPVITINNKTKKGISSIKSSLKSLVKSPIVIGATVAAIGGAAILGNAMGSGMALEQQNISMEHFIGVNNQDMGASQVKALRESFMANLRENANATPFETSDVITAGTRAINVAQGDTKSAMDLVKLAENMAALNPEKSLTDAMEAVADLKVGETERLKEFGFKISADDISTAGGVDAVIKNQLAPFFDGGAEKLSGSASGLISTIKGKVTSRIQDFGLGVVEKIKPGLNTLISFLDNNGPAIDSFANNVGAGIEFVIDKVGGFATFVSSNMPLIKETIGTVSEFISEKFGWIATKGLSLKWATSSLFNNLKTMLSVVGPYAVDILGGIGTATEALSEKFAWVATKGPFLKEVFSKAFEGIKAAVSTVGPVAVEILGAMGAAIGILVNAFELGFPYIEKLVSGTWGVIKPIFEKIGGAIALISSGIDKVSEWLGNKKESGSSNTVAPATRYVAQEVDGSFRSGLSRVPYDGFIAELHQDEQILTKQEANIYRNQSSKSTVKVFEKFIDKIADTIIIKESADVEKILKQLNDGIEDAALNMA